MIHVTWLLYMSRGVLTLPLQTILFNLPYFAVLLPLNLHTRTYFPTHRPEDTNLSIEPLVFSIIIDLQ
jgi:hypothetical protein